MNDEVDASNGEKLLKFPCEFPIKVMGNNCDAFRRVAIEIVQKHTGEIAAESIKTTPSRNGSFVSVTVTIVALSQQQLDNIYRDLTDHDDVLVAL